MALARLRAIPALLAPLNAAQAERCLAHPGRPGDDCSSPGRDSFGQLRKLFASTDHGPPGHN